jgi:hypothetical protein
LLLAEKTRIVAAQNGKGKSYLFE